MADREGAFTDFIEVSKNEPLSVVIIATLRAALDSLYDYFEVKAESIGAA